MLIKDEHFHSKSLRDFIFTIPNRDQSCGFVHPKEGAGLTRTQGTTLQQQLLFHCGNKPLSVLAGLSVVLYV